MAKAKSSFPSYSPDLRIGVLCGPERFFQDVLTQNIREDLEKDRGNIDVLRFDGATAQAADILDECRSFGLMQQFKLVIVDNADALLKSPDENEDPDAKPAAKPARPAGVGRTARQIMEGYAAAPSDQAVLLLRSGPWRPGNLDKMIAKVGWVFKCEEFRPDKAVEWAIGRCKKRHSATLGAEAARALVAAVGPDLGRIDSELGKLSVAAAGGEITPQHVRDLVGISRDEQFWAIQPTLLSGDAKAALSHLHELIELSRIDLVPLTYTYIDLARKLHGISRGLAQGAAPGELMRRFKLWGPAADAVMLAARRIKPADAAALLQAVVEADVRQKRSDGDPIRALEILTLRFTSLAC